MTIPSDLPMSIVARGKRLGRADARHYRTKVAHKAMALMAAINTEAAKREANAERAAGQGRVGR